MLAASGATTLGALVGAVGAAADGSTVTQQNESDGTADTGRDVTVRQEPGNAFYWVLPGERRLSPQVFGTPENPRRGSELLESRIEQAKGMPEPLDGAVPQLLQDLPPLVAAPEAAREPIEDAESDGIAQENSPNRRCTATTPK